MTDLPATTLEPSAPYPGQLALGDGAHHAEPLELRVQRLEDAVAALQDTRPLEERVAERVLQRIGDKNTRKSSKSRAEPTVEHIISAERRTAPPEAKAPVVASDPLPRTPLLSLTSHRWLLFDTITELRDIVRMFFDIRYHVAWTTRVTVLVILALLFTSWLWLPMVWVPVLGWILDKVMTLFLAFFAYKALSREARRYRETKG